MSEPATEWWIKVKAPAPGADYRWLCLSRPTRPEAPTAVPALPADLPSAAVREVISTAAPVGGTGELTVVLLVGPDGAPALYVEGLHAPSWPVDHQGRTITASVVGRAAGAAHAEPLARALWATTRPTAARQAAFERVVRFETGAPAGAGGADELAGTGRAGVGGLGVPAGASGSGVPAGASGSGVPAGDGGPAGVRVDAAAWRLFLRTVNRLPTPHPVDLGVGRRGSGQVALDDAARDAVSTLLGGPLGAAPPPGPRLLLVVSPLLDVEWCDRHRPWRAVGAALGGPGRPRPPADPRPPAGAAGTALPALPPCSGRPALPARSGRPALPGRAEAARLVKSVFSVLALAALCAAVVLVVL